MHDAMCAIALLINHTDICDVFLSNCHSRASCHAVSAAAVSRAQALYGALRELHNGRSIVEERLNIVAQRRTTRSSHRRDSKGAAAKESARMARILSSLLPDDHIDAEKLLKLPAPCKSRMDLVVVSGRRQPLLAQLSALLSRASAALCVRVIVIDSVAPRHMSNSYDAAIAQPQLDVRETLLGVVRLHAPSVISTPAAAMRIRTRNSTGVRAPHIRRMRYHPRATHDSLRTPHRGSSKITGYGSIERCAVGGNSRPPCMGSG